MAGLDKPWDEIGTDMSGAADNNDSHGILLYV